MGIVPLVACSEDGREDVGDTNCGVYCNKSVECYPIDSVTCVENCADESAAEAAKSQQCAIAASAQRACVGALSCDEVAAWGYRVPPDSFPCLAEFSAVEAACETACQSDDDCDDRTECSADLCIGGSCRHDLAFCPCEAPLSAYCAASECPAFDEAIADAEASCERDPWGRAEVGQCGEYQFVAGYFGIGSSWVSYFDALDTLVARSGCTDCNCIACSPGHDAFCIHYGPVPDCKQELEQVLCAPSEG